MNQLALPGLDVPSEPGISRRRDRKLRSLLDRAERRNRTVSRDLAEVRDLAGELRDDLADLAAERDTLARALNGRRLCLPVTDPGPLPRGPGIRAGR